MPPHRFTGSSCLSFPSDRKDIYTHCTWCFHGDFAVTDQAPQASKVKCLLGERAQIKE